MGEFLLAFLFLDAVLEDLVSAGSISLDTGADPLSLCGELDVPLERAPASSVDSEGSMRSFTSSRLVVSP